MLKRVLIIGSSGMLGVDLCAELGSDHELIGADLVHSPRSIVHRFCKIDITKKEGVISAVREIDPDIVIHTAAMTDVDGCELDPKRAYRINGAGTKNVALACKAVDAVLVYISTDFVFDGKKRTPYKETDKPRAISVYGRSKLAGEKAVRNILKKYIIIRTSWLYGKYGKNFVDTILKESGRKKVLKVVDDQYGSPTYTKDLARAIHSLVDLVTRSPGHQVTSYGIYHVTNTGAVSWCDYAKEILKLSGIRAQVIPISSKELARPAKRPAMSVLDNKKFNKTIKFKMRPWQSALKEYLLR